MQEKNISLNNFEECIKCTICTAYCPVIPVNPLYPGPKQAGPDGERLRLKNGFFFDENLKYCLNCKRCEVSCPSGVKIADIIHSARRKYSKKKPGPRELLLANTDFMGMMARPFAPIVNAVTGSKIGKTAIDAVMGIDKSCTFPKYQFKGFTSWFKKEAQAKQAQYSEQISFFHGCSTEYQHPEVGKAFVKVMNALGVGVNLIDEQCCGVAMIANGLWNQANKHAKHNIGVFEKEVEAGRKIVTVSSSCTLTMRDEYPGILELDNSKVRDSIVLAEKYICSLLEQKKGSLKFKKDFKARTAYHVPCHLEKLGWSIYTRKLMELISEQCPGFSMTMLESNCCGIAGTYGFKKENRKNSVAIGKPLFDQISSVDPDYVVCECETCKWQIEMSTGYTVKNPILILAEALED